MRFDNPNCSWISPSDCYAAIELDGSQQALQGGEGKQSEQVQ